SISGRTLRISALSRMWFFSALVLLIIFPSPITSCDSACCRQFINRACTANCDKIYENKGIVQCEGAYQLRVSGVDDKGVKHGPGKVDHAVCERRKLTAFLAMETIDLLRGEIKCDNTFFVVSMCVIGGILVIAGIIGLFFCIRFKR
ncbi:hypothetical protein PFISCL1PPCAC_5099, partial [Pristionchus fissidentatus]